MIPKKFTFCEIYSHYVTFEPNDVEELEYNVIIPKTVGIPISDREQQSLAKLPTSLLFQSINPSARNNFT